MVSLLLPKPRSLSSAIALIKSLFTRRKRIRLALLSTNNILPYHNTEYISSSKRLLRAACTNSVCIEKRTFSEANPHLRHSKTTERLTSGLCVVQSSAQGAFNKIYSIKYSEEEFVLQVALPIPPKLKAFSELATTSFACSEISVSVP